MPGATIDLEGLSHTFATKAGPLTVLDGVDLHLPAGSYTSLVGQSGAGKSTLLSLIGGLEPAQRGTVSIGGTRLAGLDRDGLAAFRRSTVGFVFQHFGLLDTLTAAENVEVACALAGRTGRDRRRRTAELLDRVGLTERTGHRPIELSGGERQRVAIARALANEPDLLLADEPTGNLDDDSTTVVVDLLESLPRDVGCTLVVVTHDRALAARADTRLRLVRGNLVHVDHRADRRGDHRGDPDREPDAQVAAEVAP